MNIPTSKLNLKAIDGSDVEIEYKSIATEWDIEQVENVFLNKVNVNDLAGNKMDISEKAGDLLTIRENAMLNGFITGVTLSGQPYTVEGKDFSFIVKNLLGRVEFNKLKKTIEEVYSPVDDKKKDS